MSIHDIPENERPRERCLSNGPEVLSLRECLAVILGSGPRSIGCLGLASQIIEKMGTGMGPAEQERAFFTAMEGSGSAHLREIKGLGEAGQTRLLAAFELGRRYAVFVSQTQRDTQLKGTRDEVTQKALEKIPQTLRQESREWLGFVPVYRSGELGELCVVERGVRTHVNTDPAELFARILALRPTAFFLFHNHPSGLLKASDADLDLTERVRDTARQLGIRLLGHGIVSARGHLMI